MADPFFIASGTLSPTAPCYIERAADRELVECLRAGEYCYVLDSRQKGKSSLMARAVAKLSAEGVLCAKLDIQRFGTNLDAERWYASLLNTLGQDLEPGFPGLKKTLFDYWAANQQFGPLHRLGIAIQEIILPRLDENDRRLVIFVDEVDFVRSLPFPTDEFFAGLRGLYNRRVEDPRLNRVALCLIGVATPSDLIQDVRVTPFNVGRRIVLTDFTLEECMALAPGLTPLSHSDGRGVGGEGKRLLRRIHYWTNGHPYLTQRLCEAVAARQSGEQPTHRTVDRVVQGLFLGSRAREEEPNLSDVARRILGSNPGDRSLEEYRAAILDLYDRTLTGRRVEDDPADPLVSALKLSGLVAVDSGFLKVRNQVYARVFDQKWVKTSLPDAEWKRQERAARRAVIRVATIAGAVTTALLALAVFGFVKARAASANAAEAKAQQRSAQQMLYVADMQFIQQDYESGNWSRIAKLLDETRKSDSRGIEWDYWSRLVKVANRPVPVYPYSNTIYPTNSGIATSTTPGHSSRLLGRLTPGEFAAISTPPAKDLPVPTFAGNEAASVNLVAEVLPVATLEGHRDAIVRTSFSPDGRLVMTVSDDHTIRVWSAETGDVLSVLHEPRGSILSACFSPDAGRVASASSSGTANIWDAKKGKLLYTAKCGSSILSIGFSPDSKRVVTTSADHTGGVWDIQTGRLLAKLIGHSDAVNGAMFFAGGTQIITFSVDGTTRVWNANTGSETFRLRGHTGSVVRASLFPDGRRLVTAGSDGTCRIWDLLGRSEIATLRGHKGELTSADISPDGNQIVTSSTDSTARLWDVKSGRQTAVLGGHTETVVCAHFLPGGKRVLTAGSDNMVRLWDVDTGREVLRLKGTFAISDSESCALSPDGQELVVATKGKNAEIHFLRENQFDWTAYANFRNARQVAGARIVGAIQVPKPISARRKVYYSPTDGYRVVQEALRWRGIPRFKMGGESLTGGIDSSNFVEQVFTRAGVKVPEAPVRHQMNCGNIVHAKGGPAEYMGELRNFVASPSLSSLRPGDRLIFQVHPEAMGRSGNYHTGIYVGRFKDENGQQYEHAVVHCNSTDKTVSVTELVSHRLWGVYRYTVRGANLPNDEQWKQYNLHSRNMPERSE